MDVLLLDSSIMYKRMFERVASIVFSNSSIIISNNATEVSEAIRKKNFNFLVLEAETQDIHTLITLIKKTIPRSYILITIRPNNDIISQTESFLSHGVDRVFIKPIQKSYEDNLEEIQTLFENVKNAIQDLNETNKKSAPTIKRIDVSPLRKSNFRPDLVLIASSTGGPVALEHVITKLSKNFPAPILVVQHTLPHFSDTLGRGLNQKCKINVKVAEHNEEMVAGTVYIAPAGKHMKMGRTHKIRIEESPAVNGVRPSADVLFESVATNYTGEVLVVILTGMGYDGKAGVKSLKEKLNCYCIAQSEETCVIYGMPRAIVESDLADDVLDLDVIGVELERFLYG